MLLLMYATPVTEMCNVDGRTAGNQQCYAIRVYTYNQWS